MARWRGARLTCITASILGWTHSASGPILAWSTAQLSRKNEAFVRCGPLLGCPWLFQLVGVECSLATYIACTTQKSPYTYTLIRVHGFFNSRTSRGGETASHLASTE